MGATRHSARIRFIVDVLTLVGFSAKEIADTVNAGEAGDDGRRLTVDVVKSLVRRSSFDRSRMTLAARQAHLDELRRNRLDGGFLSNGEWVAEPLDRRQLTAVAMVGAGRSGHVLDLKQVGDPRLGAHRPQLDLNADPLTYLDNRNLLRDVAHGLSELQQKAVAMAPVFRLDAGRTIQSLAYRAEISGFKPPAFEAHSPSGEAFLVPDNRIDAMRQLGRLRARTDVEVMRLLEAMLVDGEWPWRRTSDQAERQAILQEIRRSLDVAAVQLGMLPFWAFVARHGHRGARLMKPVSQLTPKNVTQ